MKTKPKQNRILSVFISVLMVFMCMTSASVQATTQKMALRFNKIEVSAGQDIQFDVIVANAVAVTEINNLIINIPDGFTVTGMSETSPAFNGTVSYSINESYINFSISSNGTLSGSDVAASIYMHVDENCEQKNYMFQWTSNAVSCTLASGSTYTPQFTFGMITVGEGGSVQTTTTTEETTTTTTTTETETTTTTTTVAAYMDIIISSYPTKTAYTTGEELDLSGGAFYYTITNAPNSMIFNMSDSEYVDTSEFDSTKAGTYSIYIRMSSDDMNAETYFEVTVEEPVMNNYSVVFVDEETGDIISGVSYNIISDGDNDPVFTTRTSDETPYQFSLYAESGKISIVSTPDGYYYTLNDKESWTFDTSNPDLKVSLRKITTTPAATTTTETTTTTTATTTKNTYSVYFVDEESGQAVSGVRYNIYSYDAAHDLAIPVQTSGENPLSYEFISDTAYAKLSTYDQALPDGYSVSDGSERWELSADNPNLTVYLSKSENISLGDVNGDGYIDSVDASLVLMEYALLSTSGIGEFTNEQNTAGDINKDGEINASDATFILTYYAYLSTGSEAKDSIDIWLSYIVTE